MLQFPEPKPHIAGYSLSKLKRLFRWAPIVGTDRNDMYNPLYYKICLTESAHKQRSRISVLFIAAVITVSSTLHAVAQVSEAASGQLPRFASLRASPVNLRTGPGRQYPKSWVFRRAGLPVEVIQIHGAWRRVRDAEGVSGWVSQHLVSQRRTALVMPWEVKKSPVQIYVDLKLAAQKDSKNVARLEAGSLLNVKWCDGRWCHVSVVKFKDDNKPGGREFSGYIEQMALWGVYPSEKVS